MSYHNKDIAAVEQCSFAPDHISIQKLVKQAMEAAKQDTNADFAIKPTFTADLHDLATKVIEKQQAIPSIFILGHGFAAFLREQGLGMEGMFGDLEGTDDDHITPPDTSQPSTYRRQPFGKPTKLPSTVSHTGQLDFQQRHFRTYISQEEMKKDLELTVYVRGQDGRAEQLARQPERVRRGGEDC